MTMLWVGVAGLLVAVGVGAFTLGSRRAARAHRRRSALLAQAAELRWQSAFDSLADGLAVVADDGTIERANRALAHFLGMEAADLTGRKFLEALGGPAAGLEQILAEVTAGGERASWTGRVQDSDRVIHLSLSALPAAGGLLVLVSDVTEQKATETQLIQTEKMAAVGQLVSGVAHELNNPLTSISGLAELLMERHTTTDQDREHLKVMYEQAERAARIVRNLLTFARQGPADTGPIDLNDVVQRASALMGHELRLRRIDLRADLADDLPPVSGDRFQIQQVVLNLLTNAVQALGTEEGDHARVVAIATDATAAGVRLRVSDTGPGIPEEQIPQIFDPFFTTKAPGEGTGLGLAITYGIVQQHGGKIEAGRAAGGGARFEVTLPAAEGSDVEPTPADTPAATEPASAVGRQPVPGSTVLLVDDDPAVRRTIGVLLARTGQRVEPARDGLHALEMLRAASFDLVLADPRIAVGSEQILAHALARDHPELKGRTIFLTADVRPETDAMLRELGWRYIRKPFDIRELERLCAEILSRDSEAE